MVEREQRKAAASSPRGEFGGVGRVAKTWGETLLRSMVMTLVGVLVSQKLRSVLSWGWGWYWVGGGKHCSKT